MTLPADPAQAPTEAAAEAAAGAPAEAPAKALAETPAETPVPRPVPVATPDEAAMVLRQFRLVFNAVRTHFRQVEKKVGVGGAQVWALHAIAQAPGGGVNGLALAMDIHQTTASNLVRLLVKRGLVRVEKSVSDRRSVHLYLAQAGHAVLAASPGPYEGVLPDALAKLPAPTLAQLQSNLGEVIQLLQVDESAAGIPLANL